MSILKFPKNLDPFLIYYMLPEPQKTIKTVSVRSLEELLNKITSNHFLIFRKLL